MEEKSKVYELVHAAAASALKHADEWVENYCVARILAGCIASAVAAGYIDVDFSDSSLKMKLNKNVEVTDEFRRLLNELEMDLDEDDMEVSSYIGNHPYKRTALLGLVVLYLYTNARDDIAKVLDD